MGSRACAKKSGATAAEVLLVSGESLSAGVRLGEVEKLKSSRERRLGLRVFSGQSSATLSTAEIEHDSLKDFIKSTVELAKLTAADPWSGLPDARCIRNRFPSWNWRITEHRIIERRKALELARTAEKAALAARPAHQKFRRRGIRLGHLSRDFRQQPGLRGEYAGTNYHSRHRADRAGRRAGCRAATGTPRAAILSRSTTRSGRQEGRRARAAPARLAENQNHARADRLRSRRWRPAWCNRWRARPRVRRSTRVRRSW